MSPPPADRLETQVLPRPAPKSHPAPRLDSRPRSRAEGIVEAIQAWLDAQL
ncbi:MAG TPA: hypothetical protein VFI53_08390 [Myxococcaceae bacterium]|nr:hypothetical protein [Myxococcaceae bacterium]